jgi:hypothetical protein
MTQLDVHGRDCTVASFTQAKFRTLSERPGSLLVAAMRQQPTHGWPGKAGNSVKLRLANPAHSPRLGRGAKPAAQGRGIAQMLERLHRNK